ncbi:MAG TPA: leucine-rich repeat domain-containing protein, partial [Verrucomicrobiae bacterium]|nr:leucine-rich repeat domain-containing protein [Verrucomicrobiae bacterium]
MSAKAQFSYSTNSDNTLTLTGYAGYLSGGVTIPDFAVVNGQNLPVVSIGNRALEYQTMSGLAFGPNMRAIGNGAFDSCRSLKSINFGTNVSYIGNSAFWGCDYLTDLTLPGSVTTMGSSVFYGCSRLKNVTLQPGLRF